MKLIGLFGVLLAISPVFAANPGKCAGNMPTTTVAECKDQACTFEYVEGIQLGYKYSFYRPCHGPSPQVIDFDCMGSRTKDECLSHNCAWVKTEKIDGSDSGLKCDNRGPTDSKLFKVQPPKKITEL